jgi:hypothetical protein
MPIEWSALVVVASGLGDREDATVLGKNPTSSARRTFIMVILDKEGEKRFAVCTVVL